MAEYPYKNRQNELNQLLLELSREVYEDVYPYTMRFANIYNDNEKFITFRHSYGSITGLLLKEYETNKDCFDNLDQNLNSIIDALISLAGQPATTEGNARRFVLFQIRIEKLRDHISMERIRKTDIYDAYLKKATDAENRYADAKILLTEARSQAESAVKIKTELVSILSIFAAVILAFMGGVSLLGSAFQSLSGASVYKVFAAILLCAMAMFNTISVLMYFVSRIVGTNITTKCKTEDCSCETPCGTLERLRKKLPLLFWLNVLFIVLFSLCLLAWFIDFKSFATWARDWMPWIKP